LRFISSSGTAQGRWVVHQPRCKITTLFLIIKCFFLFFLKKSYFFKKFDLRRYFFADDKLYHPAIKMRQNAKKSTKSKTKQKTPVQRQLFTGVKK